MARRNEATQNVDLVAGIRIHKLRIAKGLSRMQLAPQIGVTHQQLQKYEKGTNRISFGRMCLIAKVLGKPLDHFCEDADSNSEFISSQHQRMAIEVSRNFMKVTSEISQKAINDLVRKLSKNK